MNISDSRAFTLIEMSIVLVIIGLLVGGVLVGRDLMNAATVRSQITQIEKYQVATHAFQIKFNALPGDIDQNTVTQFGFTQHTVFYNPNDGLIQTMTTAEDILPPVGQGSGETGEFWQDMASDAAGRLIEGAPSYINDPLCDAIAISSSAKCLMQAKISDAARIFVVTDSSINWYGIGAVTFDSTYNAPSYTGAFTVAQAYSIDSKMDDASAYTGNVRGAFFSNGSPYYLVNPKLNANASTCVDTGGVSGAPKQYSVSQNSAKPNCTLVIKFQ